MPKTKTKEPSMCPGFYTDGSKIRDSRKPTQSFNPIKGKPEPQADLHPQTQMEPAPRKPDAAPRPWRIEDAMIDGWNCYQIFDAADNPVTTVMGYGLNPRARAELIVRAVNSFDDLLEACRQAVETFRVFDGTPYESTKIISYLETRIASAERKP